MLAWRIGTDTRDYAADDTTGKGAELAGGRWNRPGTPLLYLSGSRALACLETLAHVGSEPLLPLNRFLVEFHLPEGVWGARTVFPRDEHVGWTAQPPGLVSLDWGTRWAQEGRSALAEVPSVIVPEEANLLLNPLHADADRISVRKVRPWRYDLRLGFRRDE